ncbi:VWA domain-containing protein [Maribacter sp. 2307ULW6-5]|uniref:VWA domain-containing protein n=1 Tax=Maribacter sp. 2307ULW6-5 TaxID=3386275 RepID=UPI0039BC7011
MDAITVVLIVVSALVAAAVGYVHYFFKERARGALSGWLALLRGLAVFGVLLLLINPKMSTESYSLQKPNLAVVVDNSSSVGTSGTSIAEMVARLRSDADLKERFQISAFQFSDGLRALDTLDFSGKQTKVNGALSQLKKIYAREPTAVVLITDGNQTLGADYGYLPMDEKMDIHSVTVGDTTRYQDLRVGDINTNTYAFLKNKFPIATFVTYQGQGQVRSQLSIKVDGRTVHTEAVQLSDSKKIQNVLVNVTAGSVGDKEIVVTVNALPSERNRANNTRRANLEVLDEKTNIALISDVLHPDMGALKKSIESNEQRQVVLLPSNTPPERLSQMDVFILYQPTAKHAGIFETIRAKGASYLIITGSHTDYNFLNNAQTDFSTTLGYPEQEVLPVSNRAFGLFDISGLSTDNFPPLLSKAGPISWNVPHEPLMEAQVKGVALNTALMAVYAEGEQKKALLLGEGLWKWRMQVYRENDNFDAFDAFMGNLMRYMGQNTAKDRLNISYEKRFEGNNAAKVTATYFDEAFVFDPNANLTTRVRAQDSETDKEFPMIMKEGFYEADLSSLPPGGYTFEVGVQGQPFVKTGRFVISDFDMEKQFAASDHAKLQQLSQRTGGTHHFLDNYAALMTQLKTNAAYVPTQKSQENIVSLVDYKWVLALIVLAFALEWFIRKYNGLI